MRELNLPDIERVSGGTGFEGTKRLPTVTVTASRRSTRRWTSGAILDYNEMGTSNSLLHLAQGEGGGGAVDDDTGDPSPGDGIEGLEVTVNEDGTLNFKAEEWGFLDIDGSNAPSPGEPVWAPGHTGTTSGDWNNHEESWELLETWTPMTPPSFV